MQHALVVAAYMSGAVFELSLAQLISKPKENLRLAILSTLDLVSKRACQTALTQLRYQYWGKEIKYNILPKLLLPSRTDHTLKHQCYLFAQLLVLLSSCKILKSRQSML